MRILLVEDEAPLRETLSARLKREGFAVDSAQDGEEGLYMGAKCPSISASSTSACPRCRAWS
jgi:two-component system response regulator PhoP